MSRDEWDVPTWSVSGVFGSIGRASVAHHQNVNLSILHRVDHVAEPREVAVVYVGGRTLRNIVRSAHVEDRWCPCGLLLYAQCSLLAQGVRVFISPS